MKITEQFIDETLKIRKEIRDLGTKNKKYGFDLPIKLFLKLMHCFFSPQSYGTRIQNRFICDFGLKSVPAKKDKGDVKNKNNKHGELKCSYRSTENKFSFVQIRPYQKCDFYLFTAIDNLDDYKEYHLCILKKDIDDVLKRLKATNCHGVSENKKDTTRNELRFSVDTNCENWNFLIKNFLIEDPKTFLNNI
jgi:hypothetical protein